MFWLSANSSPDSDLSLTKCQAEAIHWKVTCLPSGEFASEQCSEVTIIIT